MARLFVIDTMIHVFRAYYSLPTSLAASDGTVTNAVLGFVGILRNLWRSQRIEHCVAVLESLSPNFREQQDDQYKANREAIPDALRQQIPLVIELLQHLGIATLSVEGYEADDVLGSLAKRCIEHGHGVTIVSNDKDLAQVLAIGGDCEVLRLHGNKGAKTIQEHIRREQVPQFYGVTAEQIPSLLALMGDSADNIVGIKGIGQKTAAKLLGSGLLSELMEHPQTAGRFAAALSSSHEQLRHNLDLATIRLNAPLPFEGMPMEQFRPKVFGDDLTDFCRRLQLKGLLSELGESLFQERTVSDIW